MPSCQVGVRQAVTCGPETITCITIAALIQQGKPKCLVQYGFSRLLYQFVTDDADVTDGHCHSQRPDSPCLVLYILFTHFI